MMRSLFSAVSGLKTNQTAMDVIGNNIANVNTIGYKGSATVFQDIFSQTINNATAPTGDVGGKNAKQVGLGVSVASIGMNMNEGSTQTTSRALDFAISGEGFFVVDNGDGTYSYTRNGNLEVVSEGYLVMKGTGKYIMAVTSTITADIDDADANADGLPDNIENGDVTTAMRKIQVTGYVTYDDDGSATTPDIALNVDADGDGTRDATAGFFNQMTIDANGVIEATDQYGKTQVLGRIVLATFNNSAGLERVGSSLYDVSSNSGAAKVNFVGDNCGTLDGGSLEMSNVDLSTELTNMIVTQRGFQANSRVVTTTDSMLEELINLKR
jgi:flagellar hook protein FlgE